MRTDSKQGDDGILGGGGRGVGAGLRWVTETWAVPHYTFPSTHVDMVHLTSYLTNENIFKSYY